MNTIAIFVDVQNIYYTVKQQFNSHFNYNEFWICATAGKEVKKAAAYATAKGDAKQSHFQNILRQIGFEIRLTPYIQRRDGSSKGDWDVGITIDMLECAGKVDALILASGDGDYAAVVKKITHDFGTFVEVYGVAELTANSLIQAASNFVSIQGKLLLPKPHTW
ncbi:MAG: NYN domain-containing protein [Chitinivibrionales bacterium]|nr:NYN domain-containing protein [Chitinivibrionales bacterium]